jgi:predicted RNA-binding Zn-ribbon protein involved in translation (DUF1610 family)
VCKVLAWEDRPKRGEDCSQFSALDKRSDKAKLADFVEFVVNDKKEPTSNFMLPVGAQSLWALGEEIRRLRSTLEQARNAPSYKLLKLVCSLFDALDLDDDEGGRAIMRQMGERVKDFRDMIRGDPDSYANARIEQSKKQEARLPALVCDNCGLKRSAESTVLLCPTCGAFCRKKGWLDDSHPLPGKKRFQCSACMAEVDFDPRGGKWPCPCGKGTWTDLSERKAKDELDT